MAFLNNYARRFIQTSKLIINQKSPVSHQLNFYKLNCAYDTVGFNDRQRFAGVYSRQMATETKQGEEPQRKNQTAPRTGTTVHGGKKATPEGIRKAENEKGGEHLKQTEGVKKQEEGLKQGQSLRKHKGEYEMDPKNLWDKAREYGSEIQDDKWKYDFKGIATVALAGAVVVGGTVVAYKGCSQMCRYFSGRSSKDQKKGCPKRGSKNPYEEKGGGHDDMTTGKQKVAQDVLSRGPVVDSDVVNPKPLKRQ